MMQQINKDVNKKIDKRKKYSSLLINQMEIDKKTPIYETELFKTRIYVMVSGHASLVYHEKLTNVTYVERTLFPGDSIGDGPLSFDNKDG
jgi:hypothetical protein